MSDMTPDEAMAEIERLRARVLELEAALAVAHGSLAPPETDEEGWAVSEAPGNAPR